MKLWLVQQYRVEQSEFEVQGVFSTEERAVAACYSDQFMVVELALDEELPTARLPYDGGKVRMWYPLEAGV